MIMTRVPVDSGRRLDVAGTLGAEPVVDRIVLGAGNNNQGASMTANVTMSGGSSRGGDLSGRAVSREAVDDLLGGLPADPSIEDLLAARHAALRTV
jgi:hypothetical protein